MIKLHFLFISRGELASIMSRYKSLKCFLYPHSPLSWIPASSQKILTKLVFRSLGSRIKNNKFCDGDFIAHVPALSVVHDVEHMPTGSSSLSLSTSGAEEREPGNEVGT